MAPSSPEAISRYVDMWAIPGMHPSNVNFVQELKSADTQHFTKNMDVVGTVSELDDSEKWNKSHLIGLRTDVWRQSKKEMARSLEILRRKRKAELKKQLKRSGRLSEKQSEKLDSRVAEDSVMQMDAKEVESQRLVLKLFRTTSQRTRWCGTIEQITTTEVHTSIGAKRSLLTLAVMLPQTTLVSTIQQNHRTGRVPAIFTFGFYDDEQMWHVALKRRWFSLGIDYRLEANGKSIGELDGKLVGVCCDSYVDIDAHPLAGSTGFIDLLTLFTASIGYHRSMRRSVRRRVKAARTGQVHRHVIEDEELRFHQNGRAA